NDIKSQWSKIMNALNIPEWDTDDTNIVYSNGGLLVLDGFDEIANEINKKPGLQQWLRYCTENANYSVIITSRPNVKYSYLKNPKLFNVIGLKSQDIRKYVCTYFRNDDQRQAENLLRKLNSSPNLKLLSHTPLYLRLFCYITRQQLIKTREEEEEEEEEEEKKEIQNISLLDELNNISISKLYEKLLVCYMKWNWIKFNGTKYNPNEQEMFSIFEMEIDYLSRIAWEGLKDGQAVISCEIQERVLNIINNKYPREHISVISQWSRINSFGFLQGQESMNPINSVYFPHLTFQEWFAAYHL
ncbi:NACHT family-like NTPase, partial [Reticulomyxa filosa]